MLSLTELRALRDQWIVGFEHHGWPPLDAVEEADRMLLSRYGDVALQVTTQGAP